MTPVVTAGEALIALNPAERGRIEAGTWLRPRVAGAECNVAIGLARLGVPVQFWGAVGRDPWGRMIVAALRSEGVDTEQIEYRQEPTGLFLKEWYGLRPEPNVYYHRTHSAGACWAAWPTRRAGLVVPWFHTTGITAMVGPVVAQTLRQAWEDCGAAVRSFDINLRQKLGSLDQWREAVTPYVAEAQVIFATQDELETLWGTGDVLTLYQTAVISACAVVLIKHGAYGASYWTQSGCQHTVSAVSVEVVDVVGAGDGFAAGVIAARIHGKNWDAALAMGNQVGAWAVAHPGDYEGYPGIFEMEYQGEGGEIDR